MNPFRRAIRQRRTGSIDVVGGGVSRPVRLAMGEGRQSETEIPAFAGMTLWVGDGCAAYFVVAPPPIRPSATFSHPGRRGRLRPVLSGHLFGAGAALFDGFGEAAKDGDGVVPGDAAVGD